jgi:hypothetical protein
MWIFRVITIAQLRGTNGATLPGMPLILLIIILITAAGGGYYMGPGVGYYGGGGLALVLEPVINFA